jgi:hypothetical protein
VARALAAAPPAGAAAPEIAAMRCQHHPRPTPDSPAAATAAPRQPAGGDRGGGAECGWPAHCCRSPQQPCTLTRPCRR